MHLHFEKNTNTKCDCSILSLSWMGKVPDDIPEEEGWKLNRTNYYQEGWLATGNIRGIVGVTYTTSHCKKSIDYPQRTNYNLRGHRSDVILVKWNEPYQKLASCDSSGIIFVWIKYEGRWSIELINDRNVPVTYFSWSHDGRMALICYQDGFVLVGSVAGQRYWSSMLNVESIITCGIWTPDDQQVYFSTNSGMIIVMDVHGAMVAQLQVSDVGITSMAWSCEKFKMEEGEDTEPGVTNAAKRSFVLAISFQNGYIHLLKSYDDVSPVTIYTGLNGSLGFVMEWNNSRELLAVAGTTSVESLLESEGTVIYNNVLKFFNENGSLLYTADIPNSLSTVSALTWGHNDKRLFIATGTQVHIAWVSKRVASLQHLTRLEIQNCISSEQAVPKLPLPSRLKTLIGNLFAQTIRCCVPNAKSLRQFVSRPPIGGTRLHCTMIRHDEDTNVSTGICYTLYLEYLGGLVPLLKGKRTSKIRPEFVIFDPQNEGVQINFNVSSSSTSSGRNDSSESDIEDSNSQNFAKNAKINGTLGGNGERLGPNNRDGLQEITDELAYVDTLPEDVKLVEVTSNIWGTKFKIHGLDKTVPANLGQVTYKTSLLHLQPRQMTLVVTELRDDYPLGNDDNNFNPNIFSEDEEDVSTQTTSHSINQRRMNENVPAIAPMSPRPNRFTSRLTRGPYVPSSLATSSRGPLARAESYDDEDVNAIEEVIEKSAKPTTRPKTIEPFTQRTVSCYSNFVNQYNRPQSGQSSRQHAISPLCCEGSVPTLQSPKNAVAPGDIIFDRPPVAHSSLKPSVNSKTDYKNRSPVNCDNAEYGIGTMNYSTVNHQIGGGAVGGERNHSIHQITSNDIGKDSSSTSSTCSNKRRDLKFIDEESPNISTTSDVKTTEFRMHRTPTVPTISPENQPDSITRSCSVGVLDSVEITTFLRRDAPNKRLVLVNKKKHKNHDKHARKAKLCDSGKSKSLDSWDVVQSNATSQHQSGAKLKSTKERKTEMPNLNETSENETTSSSENLNDPNSDRETSVEVIVHENKRNSTSESDSGKSETKLRCLHCDRNGLLIGSGVASEFCIFCRKERKTISRSSEMNNISTITAGECSSVSVRDRNRNGTDLRKSLEIHRRSVTGMEIKQEKLVDKKTEVIKSYADSPLFSRKHRFSQNGGSSISAKLFNGLTNSPILGRKFASNNRMGKEEKVKEKNSKKLMESDGPQEESRSSAIATLEGIINRLRDIDGDQPSLRTKLPHSSPSSPAMRKRINRPQSASPIRHILNSPLLGRRNRKKPQTDGSDDESSLLNNRDEIVANKQYRDLETFQKAQLRQKLKRGKIEPNGIASSATPAPLRREFVMHNKAPMWNENSQVYQLDFGGRVTQESAKNFQIEFRGKQVMQFGRIDGNAYTLDFQYPFSALQAFAVALANVTQRLK